MQVKVPRFVVPVVAASAIALVSGCRSAPPASTPGAQPATQPTAAISQTSIGPDGKMHTEFVREVSAEELQKGMVSYTVAGARPSRSGARLPPEIEPGKKIRLDVYGTGGENGEVLQVDGSWVKLRITRMQVPDAPKPGQAAAGDAQTPVATMLEVWVNFEQVRWYRFLKE